MKSLRETLAAAGVVYTLVLVAAHYATLPPIIPMHFNGHGAVDGWGGKGSLLFLVGTACFIYALLTLASYFPEHMISMPMKVARRRAALPLAVEMVGWLKVELAWMFAWLCWTIVVVATGRRQVLGTWFMPVMLVCVLGTTLLYYVRILRSPEQSA
jgi:uncharacterized membrane protein